MNVTHPGLPNQSRDALDKSAPVPSHVKKSYLALSPRRAGFVRAQTNMSCICSIFRGLRLTNAGTPAPPFPSPALTPP